MLLLASDLLLLDLVFNMLATYASAYLEDEGCEVIDLHAGRAAELVDVVDAPQNLLVVEL